MLLSRLILAAALLGFVLLRSGLAPAGADERPIDFARQARPILADNCFACHGPDEKQRKAELRLDLRESALSNKGIIVPGQPDKSELIARISSPDPKRHMPPPRSGKQLTAEQIAILRSWIRQGATWPEHWAFVRPKRPAAPNVYDKAWMRSPIDRFIMARLEREGLNPSPEAARTTLIRRLSLDLTGLPPTLQELDAFLNDQGPNAYERLVEHYLASPHFGEKMALHWLDLARFGDSDGYHDDTPRSMWQYRDYVIESFNRNKPFDQFSIEQLAGDLLPNATLEQRVATAFHRCGPTSSEGGADAKEYLAKYAVDRVNTTATAWLGVTMQCAECHDHKYDPFTTKEFYRLFAFFNQVPEDALYRGNEAPPVMATPSRIQQRQLAEFEQRIRVLNEQIREQLEAKNADLDIRQAAWEKKVQAGQSESFQLGPWSMIGPFPAQGATLPYDLVYPPEQKIDFREPYENGKLRWQPKPDWIDGKPHYLQGENCATYVYRTIQATERQAVTFYLGSDDYLKVWLNDKLVLTSQTVRAVAANQDKVTVILQPGENRLLMKVVNLQGGYGFYFSTTEKPKDEPLERVRLIVRTPSNQRTPEEHRIVRTYYRERYAPRLTELRGELAEVQKKRTDVERAIPKLRIMADVPQRRPTHILVRGDFRKLGDPVEPGVPAVLGGLPKGEQVNRLALARWLVRPEHPLTGRVAVNRLWQILFGQGLVRTPEDFGIRGEPPTHPELLDWLAVEFVESGWDIKHLLRLITTSATYRQATRVSPQALQRDPENRLWARGPRFRLSAELIRDNVLAISGLLDRDQPVGGPSVKPYQPGDLWREMSYGDSPDKAYVQDHGPALYRRGLYTFWKRSILYPAFAGFDAPNREVCMAKRAVTNTPLQAFVTLNDVTYVEAARVFAQNLLLSQAVSFDDRLSLAYRKTLARLPDAREHAILERTLEQLRKRYRDDPQAARALVNMGEYRRPSNLDFTEHAAWTALCQVLLNLDEAITRE